MNIIKKIAKRVAKIEFASRAIEDGADLSLSAQINRCKLFINASGARAKNPKI